MDIAFVVDASSSVGRKNFRRVKRFLRRLVSTFTISPRLVKVGVIVYSSYPRVMIRLGREPTLSRLRMAIGLLPYTRGGTRTGLALQLAKNRLFSGSSRKKTLLVLTDGRSGDDVLKPIQGNKSCSIGIRSQNYFKVPFIIFQNYLKSHLELKIT